jgi:hypothetical protein
LNTNIALICGGNKWSSPQRVLDDCFAITDQKLQANVTLTQPRHAAASVVLNNTTLWLTGGFILDSGGYMAVTKSTEFVQLNGTTPGPDLPLELFHHCLVSVNETTILLIGGCYLDLYSMSYKKATFYYNKAQWGK